MLANLLPRQVDSGYRGHRLAVWLLASLVLVKLLQGMNVTGLLGVGNTRRILEEVDHIPVGAFPPEAAAHVVFLFAVWGLGILTLSLFATVVLVRYRALIPLTYLLLLIEQVGRKVLSTVHLDRPLVSLAATPANLINWAFLLVLVMGFVLSLSGRAAGDPDPGGAPS